MGANPMRGEVALTLNGTSQVMRLSLGALIDLETALGADSLMDLVARFERADFTARDVLAVLVAGLRGGGWQGDETELTNAVIDGGPIAAVRAAAELLVLSFGTAPQG